MQLDLRHVKPTRFQDTCVSSLSNYSVPVNPTQLRIIQSSISISETNLKTARSKIKSILRQGLDECCLVLQNVCFGQLKYVNDTSLTSQEMSFLNETATQTGNTWNMIVSYDVFGN
ncbi:hypothetical protein SADUNF_Sadunf07G0092800 [Salix dunnii]|uniref:Pectinesterase inhibitor domain-containing protein n=1 Tax=Salix dunnii TaxID=1413687 RepID=A0A835MU52_9ROSI|nr:hypothetical protein SADUNF_Sadunf07G0092800 [Salix dunnii]